MPCDHRYIDRTTRYVKNLSPLAFWVLILKAIFEQSLRDDDDESRVKRSIHRVVRVKLHSTHATVFIVRSKLTENERSPSECSTA